MKTRAVHLETSHYLFSDIILTALRRFFARRSIPFQIRSATNFTAAKNDLMTAFDHFEISTPPLYHILLEPGRVSSVGFKTLYAFIGFRAHKDDMFSSLLCETEHFMNARPITTVSSSYSDIKALNPNYFLLGKMPASMPPRVNSHPSKLMKKGNFAPQLLGQV